MTAYQRKSRLHAETAAFLEFWAEVDRPKLEPWGSSIWSLSKPGIYRPTSKQETPTYADPYDVQQDWKERA